MKLILISVLSTLFLNPISFKSQKDNQIKIEVYEVLNDDILPLKGVLITTIDSAIMEITNKKGTAVLNLNDYDEPISLKLTKEGFAFIRIIDIPFSDVERGASYRLRMRRISSIECIE